MAGTKTAGVIEILLRLKTGELEASVASAQKSLKSLSTTAQAAGKAMSVAFSLPLAALGTYAVSSFAKFDEAMTRSIAVMGNVSAEMKSKLVAGAEEVSKKTKFSAAEAAEGYFFLASAGLSAEASLRAMSTVATFAAAGNLKLADASDALVDVVNSVGLASKDAAEMQAGMARVSSTLAKASVDTNVTIGDLAASLAGPLGGAMRQYGIDVETGTAGLEAFGSQGIKAKAAGTALSIVIRELAIKAVKNADAFKKYGISVFDTEGKFRNFIDIMKDMDGALLNISSRERIKRLDKLGFTLKNVGFIQSVLGMSGAMEGFAEANRTVGEDVRLAEENAKSFATQLQILKNTVQNAATKLGEDLAPTIISIGKSVASAAEQFQTFDPVVRKSVIGLGLFLAILPPLTFGIGALVGAIVSLKVALFAMSKMVWGVITAIGVLVGLPALLVAAFLAAGAAIYVFWDDIKQAASNFVDWFSATFPTLSTIIEATWIIVRDTAIAVWDVVKKLPGEFLDTLGDWGNDVVDVVSKAWDRIIISANDAWVSLKSTVAEWVNWFAAEFPKIAQVAEQVWNAVANSAKKGTKGFEEGTNFQMEMSNAMIKSAKDGIQAVAEGAKAVVDAENAKIKAIQDSQKAQENFNAGADYSRFLNNVVSVTKEHTEVQRQSLITGALTIDQRKKILEGLEDEEEVSKKAAAAAKKSAKEKSDAIESISKSLDKLKNKDAVGDIQDSIKEGLKNGIDDVKFDELSKNLYTAVYKSYVDAQKDALEKSGNDQGSIAKVHEGAGIVAQEALDKIKLEQIKSNTDIAKDKAKKDKAAYDDSVSYFKSIFTEALSGGTYDFREAFKEIAIEFGSQLAAAISQAMGGSSGEGSSSDGYGAIAKGISDYFSGGQGTSGTGPVADGDEYASAVNGGGSAGVAGGDYSGYASAASTAIGSQGVDKKTKSNEGTGATIGAVIGAFWGPIGAQIGAALGGYVGAMFKWGSQNPQTQARHAFANFIEEGFAKLGQVSFFDSDKKLQNKKGKDINFLESSSDFNAKGSENGVSKLNALGNEARATFLGLGMALKETLGLTDAVAEQLGAVLAENLSGNIDNARLLVQQLGLSMDDMIEKLVALGKNGAQSWLEVETAIQGVTEAFKPGLVAIGDTAGAFQLIVDSGGRGVAALKGVRDVAVEALEAGIKTMDGLAQKLLADGINPEQVNALMNGAKNRGIKTLEELANVSDRVGGGIVADMNAASASLAELWADMGNQLNDIKTKIEAIPTDVVTNYRINVTSEMSDETRGLLSGGQISVPQTTPAVGTTRKFAKGGVITGPIGIGPNGIAGEAGPELLMPAKRMADGSLGVRLSLGKGIGKSGNNITINAPYATAGSADQIRKAVIEMEPYLTSRAMDKMNKYASRRGR